MEGPVLIIMGSTRAARRCPEIAGWVMAVMREAIGRPLKLIDLRDWLLPGDDEPEIPATGAYLTDHTRAWSREIAAAAGFVIVTPQYNWGYPAPLKNALDHLYGEWRDKPVVIVSYGGHGGGKCAAQLRQVAEALKMRPMATMPALTLSEAMIHGGPIVADRDFPGAADALRLAATQLLDALAED